MHSFPFPVNPCVAQRQLYPFKVFVHTASSSQSFSSMHSLVSGENKTLLPSGELGFGECVDNVNKKYSNDKVLQRSLGARLPTKTDFERLTGNASLALALMFFVSCTHHMLSDEWADSA